ncbi:hypothetical protein [Candidatus Anaplasma sp. TIGMIC]|uniref:hypothetical protein n=1 Tax=Candidatus Anaplasma sp. TIGMIC TaxID=3020713 RepID=UPI00232CF9F6|nr:hypothetical protein [Candidatus Anaplasma sp. TIGMIC]MDB1135170.1 hypothetical protein [Candidatus Anaplasma sp. TIGMIC]
MYGIVVFLEYIAELKTQIVFVIERELESLSVLDITKFRELQRIEGELLVLLDKAYRRVRMDASMIHRGSNDAVEKLSIACIKFEKCLATKHDVVNNMQRVHGDVFCLANDL